jgi:drug/metabolite transporter (DMT)-like permease
MRRRNKGDDGHESKVVRFSFRQQLVKIAPLALVFSASVGMGNLSLKYIYPSFNQMLASVSPLITVLISILIYRKRYNTWTWLSMPIICGGLLVCSSEEVNFNSTGVVFVVLATILRALKSVMQEKLLDTNEKSLDSVSLLYYIAPWAGSILFCMSLMLEGLDPINLLMPSQGSKTGAGFVSALLVFSGLNACFLNISGNLVTAYMGAVMLQILGNVKACFAIVVSTAIFGNPVALSQACGVAMCLSGVFLYQRKGGSSSSKT